MEGTALKCIELLLGFRDSFERAQHFRRFGRLRDFCECAGIRPFKLLSPILDTIFSSYRTFFATSGLRLRICMAMLESKVTLRALSVSNRRSKLNIFEALSCLSRINNTCSRTLKSSIVAYILRAAPQREIHSGSLLRNSSLSVKAEPRH